MLTNMLRRVDQDFWKVRSRAPRWPLVTATWNDRVISRVNSQDHSRRAGHRSNGVSGARHGVGGAGRRHGVDGLDGGHSECRQHEEVSLPPSPVPAVQRDWAHGLRFGPAGVGVGVYERGTDADCTLGPDVHTADAFEVEFIADGRTVGVLTLEADQLRRV